MHDLCSHTLTYVASTGGTYNTARLVDVLPCRTRACELCRTDAAVPVLVPRYSFTDLGQVSTHCPCVTSSTVSIFNVSTPQTKLHAGARLHHKASCTCMMCSSPIACDRQLLPCQCTHMFGYLFVHMQYCSAAMSPVTHICRSAYVHAATHASG